MNQDATGNDSNTAGGSSSTQLSPKFHHLELKTNSVKHKDKDMIQPIQEGQDREMINPLATYLVSHPERGNGVFASADIRAGTIIENSPVLVITRQQWEEGKMDDCILGSYGFCWRNGGMGIGLGLASLFNHSSSPNVNFLRNYETSIIRFTAARKIRAGEELCISYAADESKLWFVKSDPSALPNGAVSEDEAEIGGFPQMDLDLFGGDDDVEHREARQRRSKAMEGVPKEMGRRERRKADFFIKQQKLAARADSPSAGTTATASSSSATTTVTDVVSPVPARPPQSASSSSNPSRTSTPNYPAIPDRSVSSPSLPPPLHSTKGKSRHEHVGPVVITPDLDWREEDWTSSRCSSREGIAVAEEEEWTGIERIKGFTEREEDQQFKDDQGLVDVWVVDVGDPKTTSEVLKYLKDHIRVEPELKHLKRVCRRRGEDGQPANVTRVALCTINEIDREALVESLSRFSPTLALLEPYVCGVPKSPARDQAEFIEKHAIWPVSLAPPLRKPDTSPRFWSAARRAWVEAGMKRVIALALEAKAQGELPVAVYCTSPPPTLWPRMEDEGFIPPTPGLRASSHDTRISENHPLRHANLNCIASIARLRTVPPFSEMLPTRNGADYLLTSLSLFTLHEPCTMCTMALLHSRVREVFYIFPSGKSGGFEGEFGLHSRKDLNHRFEVWKWKHVDLSDEEREALRIEEGVEI